MHLLRQLVYLVLTYVKKFSLTIYFSINLNLVSFLILIEFKMLRQLVYLVLMDAKDFVEI
jgi:hypothetical protein